MQIQIAELIGIAIGGESVEGIMIVPSFVFQLFPEIIQRRLPFMIFVVMMMCLIVVSLVPRGHIWRSNSAAQAI